MVMANNVAKIMLMKNNVYENGVNENEDDDENESK